MSEYAGANMTQAEVDDFVRRDSLIRQGKCPNGCGTMAPMGTAERIQSCGLCGFFTNVQPD